MKVKELKTLLADLPDDMTVVMSKDGEGNGYSPLSQVDGDNQVYIPDSTYSGEIMLKELRGADRSLGYTEEDVADPDDNGEDCVVLWPTN